MANKREKAPARRMRKIALVICEGETEESYVNLLKKWYKSPIRIVPRIEGNKITQSLIDCRIRELKISPWDKVQAFLMYDMDVPAVNEKLLKCKANLLLSNPCFELWLLLHTKEQTNAISTDALIKELKKSTAVWRYYAKSTFSETQQSFLKGNTGIAIERAKKLKELQNPSTQIYKLIELLNNLHKDNSSPASTTP